MCKRGTVERIVLENLEITPIKPVQTILRTDPDIPETILENAKGFWLRQTIFKSEMIKLDGLSLTVLEGEQKQTRQEGEERFHRCLINEYLKYNFTSTK